MKEPLFVELYSSSPTGLRAQAEGAATEALRRRTTLLLLGLDSLSAFDDAAISATIIALRKLREIGGTVRLVTRNADHRKDLALSGLDRVFDVVASAEGAANAAAVLRIDAQAKGGELLARMAKNGERATKGQPSKEKSQPATLLQDPGVTKTESHRWQQVAEVAAREREA